MSFSSFMWSFEKIHRCMAHLFLGQFVSTFDEEFRILFAQSQPLIIENVFAPVEDFSLLQKRQHPSEITSLYRDPRKFLSPEIGHPEEWARHSYDERMDMDWRMMPLKRKESLHGPADMYSRFPSQQPRMDPSFEQGPSRMPMMDNPAFQRHSYAEGVHGRYPFLPQQGIPEPENHGRQFHRQQQPYPGPGKEADYSAYDKFWSQDYHLAEQYSEPALPQEMEPPDNFDPVLNYLSSTRNVDFDLGSDKLPPAADLPFSSSYPRRLSSGQTHACQTSPTPSNPTEQKQFFQEPNPDRKDPVVKRGLRDWRISSYLSAYENKGDEGLSLAPHNVSDPFEEPSNPIEQTAPVIDISAPKIPNVREFKVPAIPRASQMPSYAKNTALQEQPKKLPDEPTSVVAETKTTPTPSESSSTTEGEKADEAEQKEPKTSVLHREDSFRRKYNAAVPRCSRLRSSLIFSSLEQQHTSQDTKTTPGQQDEESDKNEAEQSKQPFVSQILGQRRSAAREPFEWSRYIKSSTFDNSATDSSKPDDGKSKAEDKDPLKDENSKDLSGKCEVQESLKSPDVEQTTSSPSMPQSKPSEAELPKTDQPIQPPTSLLTSSLYVDMSDPDMRLMFFKELAAKRKAAKAAEAEKNKEKVLMKTPTELKNNTIVKKEEPGPEETTEKMAATTTSEGLSEKNDTAEDAGKTVSTEACKSDSQSLEAGDKTNKEYSQIKNDPNTTQICEEAQTRILTDSEMMGLKSSQPAATVPVSAEPEAPQSKPPEEPKLSNPAVEKSSPSYPPTQTNATPASVFSLAQGTDEGENPCPDSTSNEPSSLTTSSVEVPPSSAFAALDSNIQNTESVHLATSISSPSLPPESEQHSGSESCSSNLSALSSSSDHILPDSGSQISPGHSPASSSLLSHPAETISSNVTPEDSTLTSSISSPNAQETVSPLAQSVGETSQKSISQTESESTQAHLDSVSQLTSSETPSVVDSAHEKSDIALDTCAAGSEPNTSSLQSTTETDSEESCAPTPSEKDVPELENSSGPHVGEESEGLGSSKDLKADSTLPSLNPLSPESCSPHLADLETKSRSDQNDITIPTLSPADPTSEHSLAETNSPVCPDLTNNTSQSETIVSPQDPPIQVPPPSELNLTGPVSPSPAETISCSPLTESVEPVLSPKAEKTVSPLHSPSHTTSLPEQVTADSNEIPMLPSTDTCSPTEPTSKVPTESDLPCKTPASVISETHSSEQPVVTENSKMDSQIEVSQEPEMPDPGEKKTDKTDATNKVNKTTTQESTCSEKTNDQVRQNNCSELPEITSSEVVPLSPQSKQPKSSQSRYHSSTANVLSSSNLRDDTKLLLEQISANSQSRNEASKESPVTDDEKEDEADKNAKREKERGMKSFNRGQPKSNQDREKLLERIQTMRKDRKVYSRFEV